MVFVRNLRIVSIVLALDQSLFLAVTSRLCDLILGSHAFHVSEMAFISRQTFAFGIMLFSNSSSQLLFQ